jgi:hypothetical protein
MFSEMLSFFALEIHSTVCMVEGRRVCVSVSFWNMEKELVVKSHLLLKFVSLEMAHFTGEK